MINNLHIPDSVLWRPMTHITADRHPSSILAVFFSARVSFVKSMGWYVSERIVGTLITAFLVLGDSLVGRSEESFKLGFT